MEQIPERILAYKITRIVSMGLPLLIGAIAVGIAMLLGNYLAACLLVLGDVLGFLDGRLVDAVKAIDKDVAGIKTLELNAEQYKAVVKLLRIAADEESKI